MPTIDQMRSDLYFKYKGGKGKKKVLALTNSQVIAIWSRIRDAEIKRLEEEKKKPYQPRLF